MLSLVCKWSHSYPETLEKSSRPKIENRLLDIHAVDRVSRTSILPATAAEMSAEQYSLSPGGLIQT